MSWLVPRVDLTPEQLRTVELPTKTPQVVVGLPGSGKTQVLLHRADHLRYRFNSSADRFRIFLFTNVLRDYIRSAFDELGLPEDSASTFDHWCREQYEAYLGPMLPFRGRSPDFGAIRTAVLEPLRSRPSLRYSLQFALVDEGQDLTEESFEILKLAAHHVSVFADPLQQIYRGASEAGILRVLDTPQRNVTLLGAYRNSADVATLASYFIPDAVQRSQYLAQLRTANVARERPVLRLVESHDEEMDRLAEVVRQRRLMNERVGILLPQTRFVHGYAAALEERGVEVEVALPARRGNPSCEFGSAVPKITSYHSAKGLTFDTVLMPRLTDDSFAWASPEIRRRLLFVGITRATRWVYLSRRTEAPLAELPSLLEAADRKQLEIRQGATGPFARSASVGDAPSPMADEDLLIGL